MQLALDLITVVKGRGEILTPRSSSSRKNDADNAMGSRSVEVEVEVVASYTITNEKARVYISRTN